MVTHQLQVERRTVKVCQPETAILPLCYATNIRLILCMFRQCMQCGLQVLSLEELREKAFTKFAIRLKTFQLLYVNVGE